MTEEKLNRFHVSDLLAWVPALESHPILIRKTQRYLVHRNKLSHGKGTRLDRPHVRLPSNYSTRSIQKLEVLVVWSALRWYNKQRTTTLLNNHKAHLKMCQKITDTTTSYIQDDDGLQKDFLGPLLHILYRTPHLAMLSTDLTYEI